MRILLGHEMNVLVFDILYDKLSLRPIAILNHRLNNTAPVVLVAKVLVLVANECDAFIDQLVLLFVVHFTLFHEQATVVYLQTC
jgi:hypothetical protein